MASATDAPDILRCPEGQESCFGPLDDWLMASQALYEAERAEKAAEEELIEAMETMGIKSIQDRHRGLTVSRSTRRTVKILSEQDLRETLLSIGIDVPMTPEKIVPPQLDKAKVQSIAEMYNGDFPGVEINETKYLTRKARK